MKQIKYSDRVIQLIQNSSKILTPISSLTINPALFISY